VVQASNVQIVEMCADRMISLSEVSKCHLIYERPEDRLKQIVVPRIRRLLGMAPKRFYSEFWALRDISVQVHKGETLGIIGRNGAGKSTLLQILCGTLNPTSGSVETKGRIAALLELGAGFNPEFTGRENVYFNAAVLGLEKRQIDERFEDIAAFADIGEFIDRPVKTYSSGMFVRLAFAVIAHVDADILVIDEALAVGDAVFNQKCMRFLRAFKQDKTLIFVSHDVQSVINLCDKAMWLERGTIRMLGQAKEVAEAYMEDAILEASAPQKKNVASAPVKMVSELSPRDTSSAPVSTTVAAREAGGDERQGITLFDNLAESAQFGLGKATISSVRLSHRDSGQEGVFRGGDPVSLKINASIGQDFANPIVGFAVKDRLGQWLFGENTHQCGEEAPQALKDRLLVGSFQFTLPRLPSGAYSMMVAVAEGTPFQNLQHHWIHDALIFNVVDTKPGLGLVGIPFDSISLTVAKSK
jgi:lipopolysaccharide transport system ATP-binding protein